MGRRRSVILTHLELIQAEERQKRDVAAAKPIAEEKKEARILKKVANATHASANNAIVVTNFDIDGDAAAAHVVDEVVVRRKYKKRKLNALESIVPEISVTAPLPDEIVPPIATVPDGLYCSCQAYSFEEGEPSAACTNADACLYGKWFHYGCIGKDLSWEKPLVWFCKGCISLLNF